MNKLRLIWIMVAVAGFGRAQDVPANPKDVLPPPPWLVRAPDMSHWVITFKTALEGASPSADEAPATPEADPKKIPQRIEVTKTGKIILAEASGGTGPVVETWQSDGFLMEKSSSGKGWLINSVPPAIDPFNEANYVTSDFAGFDWITAANFVGAQEIQGKKCLVFKDKVLTLSVAQATSKQDNMAFEAVQETKKHPGATPTSLNIDMTPFKEDVEADIDFKTHLPVSLTVGKTVRTFEFLPPPQADLEVPSDAELILTQQQKREAAVRNMSPGTP